MKPAQNPTQHPARRDDVSELEMELALERLLRSLDAYDRLAVYLTRAADGTVEATLRPTGDDIGFGRLTRSFGDAAGEQSYPVVSAAARCGERCARVVLVEDTGEIIPIPTSAADPQIAALDA